MLENNRNTCHNYRQSESPDCLFIQPTIQNSKIFSFLSFKSRKAATPHIWKVDSRGWTNELILMFGVQQCHGPNVWHDMELQTNFSLENFCSFYSKCLDIDAWNVLKAGGRAKAQVTLALLWCNQYACKVAATHSKSFVNTSWEWMWLSCNATEFPFLIKTNTFWTNHRMQHIQQSFPPAETHTSPSGGVSCTLAQSSAVHSAPVPAFLSQSDSTCPKQRTINPSSHITAPWWYSW